MKSRIQATTPKEYLRKVDAGRKPEIAELHALIVKTTGLKPYIHAGMLAYGRYHYRYRSGREGDWFCIGLAPSADGISLHAGYGLRQFRSKLPKAKFGKSCIRLPSLEDIDLGVLRKIVKRAARMDGTTIVT